MSELMLMPAKRGQIIEPPANLYAKKEYRELVKSLESLSTLVDILLKERSGEPLTVLELARVNVAVAARQGKKARGE